MPPGKTLRRSRPATFVLAALFLACAVGPEAVLGSSPRLAPSIASGAPSASSYVPGEAIVRFKPGVSAAGRRAARVAADVELEGALGLSRAQLVDVDGSVRAAIRRLERQPAVAYAQPNFRYEATAVSDDTFSELLWGLSDPVLPEPGVYVEEAWKTSRGNGQVIAVLDTGVDLTHPDLAPNLWVNAAEQAGTDDVDDDGNGKVDDVHGFDFVDEDGDPDDYEFHGTHVAGTAAAVADNKLGIAGVAPEAEIMAVRVLDGDGEGSTAEIAAGIEYAADNGADVINMSLGGPAGSSDQLTEDAIEAATNAVVVVAAGNEAADNEVEPHSPCVLPQANLICVAAMNKSGTLASFSNYGAKSVDIAAPGGGDIFGGGILSARTDYKTVFSEDFEGGIGGWEASAESGSIPWGPSAVAFESTGSAADSPGSGVNYAPNSDTQFFTEDPLDLTGERGCRSHFDLRYDIQPAAAKGVFFDFLFSGALTTEADVNALHFTAGSSNGLFEATEISISPLDGRSDVFPAFGLFSDGSIQRDGAYVDNVRLLCRDESYDPPEASNYVRFSGTSMATPHVAGVVALVRAAAPALDPEEVVAAVLDGASAIPTVAPGKRTVTEGIADACKGVAIATGGDVATACPASSEPTPQPPEDEESPPPPTPVAPDTETPNPSDPGGTPRSAGNAAPRTFFLRRPPKILRTEGRTAKAVFRLGSNEAEVAFLCKLDRAPFRFCRRTIVRRVALGPHVFRVKARDASGKTDRTPAVYRFRVALAG